MTQDLRLWVPDDCRGLIFDCDGTLVDSMPLHYQAFLAVLPRHNLHLTEERFYQWAGTPVDEVIHRLATEKGLSVNAEAIAQERDDHFHNLPANALQPVEAVVQVARQFHRRLPMAVATGSTRVSAEASLQAIGILHLFDAVISSHEAGRPKPAPDVFLKAAQTIAIPPAQCLAFEDGDVGIQAAREAGMRVIDIRPWLVR